MNNFHPTLLLRKKPFVVGALLCLVVCLASVSPFFNPPGLVEPEPIGKYLNGAFPQFSSSEWEVELAYPNLTFPDPMAMIELPDQSGFYVAGKQGYLWKISKDPNTSEKELVLDFSDQVDTQNDAGLINVVLHPEFGQAGSPNRGYLYIIYRYHPDGKQANCQSDAFTRLSRFHKPDGSDEFDTDSELVLVQLFDTHCFHTGGGMFFGLEGFLYFTFGDAGGARDQFNTTQVIDDAFFSGLFRIDVDKDPSRSHPIRRQPIDPEDKPADLPSSFTQGYYIPNDNPWQDEGGGVLEEFYALGLRNPHRATQDPVTGKIWVGDVGQAKREEISILEKGGNYQWPYREGNIAGDRERPSTIIGVEKPPVFDYTRADGNSVIGGFVYRGPKYVNSLIGQYIFGDHGSRNIWTLNPENGEVTFLATVPASGVGGKNGISSFATDSEGEVYILKLYGTDLDGGLIYKLKKSGVTQEFPELLSETGAFSDLASLTPAPGLIPYNVNSPLWSDRAAKFRWVAIPNDGSHNTDEEQVTYSPSGDWQFPTGTVFVKHFELPVDERNLSITKRLETRFFVLTEDGAGYGVTYKWNDEGTDARLLYSGDSKDFIVRQMDGSYRAQTWDYPSRTGCMACHTANANFVLGVKTWQLNGDQRYKTGVTDNQLRTWSHLGIFANPFDTTGIDEMPKAYAIDDESVGLETRVKSYLDANCSNCHRPNGVEAAFDARFSTPMEEMGLINTTGISTNTPIGALVVKPRDPAHSELWVRDNAEAGSLMPPIGRRLVDEPYIETLTAWINSLDDPACQTIYLTDLQLDTTLSVNGWGPAEIDQSNGGKAPNNGRPLTINGQVFERGLGTHANASIIYHLNGQHKLFRAFIGVDDATCDDGSVIFKVFKDSQLAYESPLMTQADDAVEIAIDVTGVQMLNLVVDNNGDSTCDHADWADAKFENCTFCIVGQACDDGDPCTTNDVFNTDCNCEGSYQDFDEDGVCAGYDADDYDSCVPDNRDNNCNPCRDLHVESFEDPASSIWNLTDGSNGARDGWVALSGSYSLRPAKRGARTAALFTDALDLRQYNRAEVSFSYRPYARNGDDTRLKLEVSADGGATYTTVREWNFGERLKGDNWYTYEVEVNDITFTADTRFRFALEHQGEGVIGYLDNLILRTCEIPDVYRGRDEGPKADAMAKRSSADKALPGIRPPQGQVQPYGRELEVVASPNPFRDELTLLIRRPIPEMKQAIVRIVDLSGRIVYQKFNAPFGEAFSIPTTESQWESGIYFVRVQASDYMKTVKVIKQ